MIYCVVEHPGRRKVSQEEIAYATSGHEMPPPDITIREPLPLPSLGELRRRAMDSSSGMMIQHQRAFKRIAISYREVGKNRFTGLPEYARDRAFYLEYPY